MQCQLLPQALICYKSKVIKIKIWPNEKAFNIETLRITAWWRHSSSLHRNKENTHILHLLFVYWKKTLMTWSVY